LVSTCVLVSDVNTITGIVASRGSARIISTTWKPSMSGICKSTSIKSGCSRRAVSIAMAPFSQPSAGRRQVGDRDDPDLRCRRRRRSDRRADRDVLEDGNDRLQKINAALLNGDEPSARKAAHSLKGMSGAIGATHLSALSHGVEHAEPGAIDRTAVRQLEDEFQRVYDALRAA